jgi:hypothetical protein
MNAGLYSSSTGEWLTPKHIVDKVVECLGHIDLDPCAEPGPPWNVPARVHYTKAEDGLAQNWHSHLYSMAWTTVYCNPPYGREIGNWIVKLCREYVQGNFSEAIALLPARTDTAWFALLAGFPVLFLGGRLHFGGSKNSAPFPSCLFYLGPQPSKFRRVFRDMGTFWEPMERGL